MAELFDRDVKTIGKHINNALKEELKGFSVVAKFAITAADGKIYNVEHYNIETITSVGYRVKSKRTTLFRFWANKLLKEYLIKRYVVNKNMIDQHYTELKQLVQLLGRTVCLEDNISNEETHDLIQVVSGYAYALDTLDRYDYQQLEISSTCKVEKFHATYENAMEAINAL